MNAIVARSVHTGLPMATTLSQRIAHLLADERSRGLCLSCLATRLEARRVEAKAAMEALFATSGDLTVRLDTCESCHTIGALATAKG